MIEYHTNPVNASIIFTFAGKSSKILSIRVQNGTAAHSGKVRRQRRKIGRDGLFDELGVQAGILGLNGDIDEQL